MCRPETLYAGNICGFLTSVRRFRFATFRRSGILADVFTIELSPGESLFDDALIADISGTIPAEAHFQHGDELINVLMDYPNVEPQHEGMQGAAVVQQRQVKTLQTSMATALRTAVAMEPLTAVEPDSASCRTLTDAQRLRLATLVGQSFGYWALLGLTGVYLILAIALIAIYFNRRAHPAVSPRSPLFVQVRHCDILLFAFAITRFLDE